MISTLEATAPCRLELIGGRLEPAASPSPEAVPRLAVAVDRRVLCRVEPRETGIEIHVKDSGERIIAEDARELLSGPFTRVAQILVAAGVTAGIRVVTHIKVPKDAGLSPEGAEEVALLAALGLRSAATTVQTDLADSDRQAALIGGAHVLRMRNGATSVHHVKSDPARLEECLLLVDPGSADEALSEPTFGAERGPELLDALEAGAYDEVATILKNVHRGRFESAPSSVKKLVDAIERAGGAAWPSGRLLAVWAAPGARSPGPREAVSSALQAAGVRSFPVRVDLRGLEVE